AAFPHSYVHPERLSRHIYVNGEGTTLDFVSAASPQRSKGLTAWRLSNDDEGLMLKLAPAFAGNPAARLDELDAVLLLPGYRASFRYLLQRNPEEKAWLDTWNAEERQSLPLAVHVLLSPLDDAREPAELEIVAPIRAWRHAQIAPQL